MNKTQEKRLLTVARLLRERMGEKPWKGADGAKHKKFNMGRYAWDCGTPACALGTYAANTKVQGVFRIGPDKDGNGNPEMFVLDKEGVPVDYADDVVQDHFGVDEEEAGVLFSGHGCGGAKTPGRAARFIEKFVEKKREYKAVIKRILK